MVDEPGGHVRTLSLVSVLVLSSGVRKDTQDREVMGSTGGIVFIRR